MVAHENAEPSSAGSRIETVLTWLGGGDWRDVAERYERSTYVIAGVVVLLDAVLAWLMATLAVAGSTSWPLVAVLALCLVFGLLVGAVTRAIATGVTRGGPALVGRAAIAVAVGAVVGELAALVVFSGSIDRQLDERAVRNADSAPAVAQASASLDRMRDERGAMEVAIEQARGRRDEALVVARCEYNPSPQCPQTRITGVPGAGPETRTANEVLADTQRELDAAIALRDRRAPALDKATAGAEQTLAQARTAAVAHADRSLGARWVAMNSYTLGSAGALLLRLVTVAFFVVLSLLPLILRLWRGQTSHDRRAAARAERERAELEADTAIAVKQAEVRAAAEILWAEHQLVNARLAVEAQTEIDRANHRRRVAEALEAPAMTTMAARVESVEDDVYLPIAAEAEAASRAVAELPAGDAGAENLPAEVDEAVERSERGPSLPTIPDVTKAAARWIRPLVPPIVARAIDTTTQPLRVARQAFEEVEEITFAFKRTRKVTFDSEERSGQGRPASEAAETSASRWIESSVVEAATRDHDALGVQAERSALGRAADGRELTAADGSRELRGPDGPRQLPPAE